VQETEDDDKNGEIPGMPGEVDERDLAGEGAFLELWEKFMISDFFVLELEGEAGVKQEQGASNTSFKALVWTSTEE